MNRNSDRPKKIISCFGKMTNKSTARVLGVSPARVSFLWKRAGLSYDTEDFIDGWY